MALKLSPDAQPSVALKAQTIFRPKSLDAPTSRAACRCATKAKNVSSAGAAGNADLGGSSKYSGKHPGDARWIRVPCQQRLNMGEPFLSWL